MKAYQKAKKRYKEQKKIEDKRAENKSIQSTLIKIFDSLEAIVYIADLESYELIYTNNKFNKELGYSKIDRFTGKKCWEIIQKNMDGPCSFCTNSKIVDENGNPTKPYEWEFYNPRVKKQYRIIDKAIEWERGKLVRFETAYDITEKKKYDELYDNFVKASETEKRLEIIEALAGGVAHKINNSLSVITGHIDLMEMDLSDTKQLKKSIHSMKEYSGNMVKVTGSLLAYARGGKYNPSKFNLVKLFQKIINELKLPNTIFLATDFPEQKFFINADESQISMLIYSIVENAVEATTGLGTINITLEKTNLNQSELHLMDLNSEKDYMLLTIRDDGSGMDKNTKEKAFDPFFTTKFQGRGLGLSAAYGIVKNHEGYILINSTRHTGTAVMVYFPIKKSQNFFGNDNDHIGVGVNNRKTILLIEDEPGVRMLFKTLLEKMGYEVVSAENASQAIELLSLSNKIIDLALLDFSLPDMRGDELFPHLKRHRPEMEIVILSGYAITEPIQRMLEMGAKTFLQKPIGAVKLKEEISKILPN